MYGHAADLTTDGRHSSGSSHFRKRDAALKHPRAQPHARWFEVVVAHYSAECS